MNDRVPVTIGVVIGLCIVLMGWLTDTRAARLLPTCCTGCAFSTQIEPDGGAVSFFNPDGTPGPTHVVQITTFRCTKP